MSTRTALGCNGRAIPRRIVPPQGLCGYLLAFTPSSSCQIVRAVQLQEYLTYNKKMHPPRTPPWAYAWDPKGVPRGWASSYGRGTPVWSEENASGVLSQNGRSSRSTGVPRLSENAPPLGPYDRPIPRALRLSYGGGAVFS